MSFEPSSLFDEYADKMVSANDKIKRAYVLSVDQLRVLNAANTAVHRGDVSGAPALRFEVLGSAERQTVMASLYGSIRGESGRKIEARMGRDLITVWLNAGDILRIGRIGPRIFLLKTDEAFDIDSAARTLARTMPAVYLKSMVRVRPATPARVEVTTSRYVRNPVTVAAALQRSGDSCERPGCTQRLFWRDDDSVYLEVHHVIPLSEDGLDVITNVAALCPSCHRECHYGNRRTSLRRLLLQQIAEPGVHGVKP